ncbi:MAG TPA: fumarylacetoacetate hydrolase family protein [Candidatus Microbacterium pullistercoris]|nr:fumarylacetoacetate hydrolase family protein [Candidatus Microbacterium pullistercoris]
MRLATLRHGDGATSAVVIADGTATEIAGAADIGDLLADPDWRARAASADGRQLPIDRIDPEKWGAVVTRPGKVVCVGLNYRAHILEMGRELPAHPTLFAKFGTAITGPYDDIAVPAHAAHQVDWEAELAVVIGERIRDADTGTAARAIAGYSVLNDVSMRDFQNRTVQWMQGKNFEATTPFGPVLVTPDEFVAGAGIRCVVNGERVQDAATDDLVFTPVDLIAYISSIFTLEPGDVIATGTPGGVGHARTPARYLADGDELVTVVDGIGELRNRIRVR